MALRIEAITETPTFCFLWCGAGQGLEWGRHCLKKWCGTQRARIARPRLAATLHLTPVLTLTSPATSTLTFNLHPHLTLPSPHPTLTSPYTSP